MIRFVNRKIANKQSGIEYFCINTVLPICKFCYSYSWMICSYSTATLPAATPFRGPAEYTLPGS